jgi:hypothetical protein
MPYLVEFEWYRDETQNGWSLRPAELPSSLSSSAVDPRGETGTYNATNFRAITLRKPLRIVHCDGKLRPYAPLKNYSKLFEPFSRVSSAEELLSFIEKFGPLSDEGRDPSLGDNVVDLLAHAKQMRLLLHVFGTGQKKQIAKILGPKGRPLDESHIGDVRATLVFDPVTQIPRLQFIPRNLLNAIWLQLGEYLGGDPNLMVCRLCGQTFERGPGHRRADATFCSDEHKAEFHSKRRSDPSKSRFRRRA